MNRLLPFLLIASILSGCVRPVRTGLGEFPTAFPVETVLQLQTTQFIEQLVVSDDRRTILTHEDAGVTKLWEYPTGRLLRTFGNGSGFDFSVFIPPGRFLLTYERGNPVRIIDVATGVVVNKYDIMSDLLMSLVVSEDGRHLITADYGGGIQTYSLATGTLEDSISIGSRLSDLHLDADGRYLVGITWYDGVKLIDRLANRAAGESQVEDCFHPISIKVKSVAISPDGKLVAAAGESYGKIALWDIVNRKSAGFLQIPVLRTQVNDLSFNRDGTLLAAACDGGAVVWDMGTRQSVYSDTGYYSRRITFVPNRKVIISTCTNSSRVISFDQPAQCRQLFDRGNAGITDIALSSRGSYFSMAFWPAPALIWNLRDPNKWRKVVLEGPYAYIRGQQSSINAIAFSPDENYLVAGGWGGLVKGWYTSTGETFTAFQNPTENISGLAYSPDGRNLAIGGINWAGSWDFSTSSFAWELPVPEGQLPGRWWGVSQAGVDPALSRIIMGYGSSAPAIYDFNSGEKIRNFGSDTGDALTHYSISPDGRRSCTHRDGDGLSIWDCSSGLLLKKIPLGGLGAPGPWLDQSAIILASWRQRRFCLYDVDNEREIIEYKGHCGIIDKIICTPNRKTIISTSHDKTVRFWDAHDGRLLGTLMTDQWGNWAMVDSNGRFDHGGEGLDYIHMVVGLETFSPLLYFNDYYYPGLLSAIINRPSR